MLQGFGLLKPPVVTYEALHSVIIARICANRRYVDRKTSMGEILRRLIPFVAEHSSIQTFNFVSANVFSCA